MRVYLSGPMTGLPEFNYPAFAAATEALRAAGYTVFSPHEFLPNTNTVPSQADLRRAFAAYCKFICEEADAVVVLAGWTKSKGATCEVALARNCGLPVLSYDNEGFMQVVPNVPLRPVLVVPAQPPMPAAPERVITPADPVRAAPGADVRYGHFPWERSPIFRDGGGAHEDRTPYGDS